MSSGIDFADLVKRVSENDVAMDRFREIWRVYAPAAFDVRLRLMNGLRVSDSGRCALELYHDIHDLYAIPEDWESVDSRMELGIVDGMKTACKIAAGVLTWYWPLTVKIEVGIDCDEIPGHADAIVYAEPDPIEVVECKLTMQGKPIIDPLDTDRKGDDRRYWVLQAAKYALGVGAPSFVVLAHAPASFHGPKRRQFRYDTETWREEVVKEYARLQRATWETRPKPDPQQSWRCEYCRVGPTQCEMNVNPRGLAMLPGLEAEAEAIRELEHS